VKYSDLPAPFSFQPIAVETLRPISESAIDFLRELGCRISSKFQEERRTAYLFQRLSVTVQHQRLLIPACCFICIHQVEPAFCRSCNASSSSVCSAGWPQIKRHHFTL